MELLSARPLRWVGRRSYGIYLIHWPVIVFVSEAPGEQPDGPLSVAASSRSSWGWPRCRTG